ncbi:MAG TPA: hypothetical protein VG456_04765 [Candidatus Sulfopaludibacter sp.]|nr:hypothetical protein [Candidatus Sulfopaludibacter sp.]
MERSTNTLRAYAVASAAAHDLNDELTIIFSTVCDSLSALEPGHPARAMLLDARSAAQRCAWKASGLLNFTARAGVPPIRTSLESLLR